MPVVVNTNTQSIFAQRALNGNTMNLQRTVERLSTGFRINRAADDAAGLSITEKMTSKIRGMDQAKRNINDAIALIQTSEAALGTVQDNLQRIRELSVQALNGSNGLEERNAIQREINERIGVIETVAKQSNFNGVQLISTNKNDPPGTNDIQLQAGPDQVDRVTITIDNNSPTLNDIGIIIDMDADSDATSDNQNGTITQDTTIALGQIWVVGEKASKGGVKSYLGNDGSNPGTAGYTNGIVAPTLLADLDAMMNNVSRMRSELGAIQNSLESRMSYIDAYAENLRGARSRIQDADVAHESSQYVKFQILQQSSAGMLQQANASAQIALDLLP